MTAVEKLYQIIQTLPTAQINEVLDFAEFLQSKQDSDPSILEQPKVISPGTLTGLKGIAKRRTDAAKNAKGVLNNQPMPTDDELKSEYADYLTQKYQ